MVDKSKKPKKATMSEADSYELLQRYSAHRVITLLQEMGQASTKKVNWQEMVNNTATGISSAREYQMLWRHLAYRDALVDRIDPDEAPLDDDSDLEFELEAEGSTREASAEAAACAKVLLSSGPVKEDDAPNNSTIVAPLNINIPICRDSVIQGKTVVIPVSLEKQPLPSGICGEKRPNTGATGVTLPPRRKRKAWSTQDDTKLTAAVQKHGERNWATIAKEDFGDDRKASELSQRWTNLRKKQSTVNVGTSSQLSETQLAARRAVSLALDMAMGDNLKSTCQINSGSGGLKSQLQPQKASVPAADQQLGKAGPSKTPQVVLPTSKWPPTSTPDSMVKAAAVAAGARIATSADASSLIEAARSQNVVHITTGGATSMMKASITSQLPSNVHFIRNGLSKAPIATLSSTKPTIARQSAEAQCPSVKPTTPTVRPNPNPPATAPVLNTATVQSSDVPKISEQTEVSTSTSTSTETKGGADLAEKMVPQDQSADDSAMKENSSGGQTKDQIV